MLAQEHCRCRKEIIGALEDFGIEIGRAFQLVDDLLILLANLQWVNQEEQMFMMVDDITLNSRFDITYGPEENS